MTHHALAVLALAVSVWPSAAQITLEQAVRGAAEKYPAVRASLEEVAAAAASINLARTSYLPRADLLGQVNRATHNNVFGQVLPQPLPVIPAMSGPVLHTNSLGNVWGTALGAMVSWEPFDFGLRKATVEASRSTRERAEAQVAVTRLQVSTAAADAFLTMLAAEQTLGAARAAVERARVLDEVVSALAKNELRPGAEASRAHAELTQAEIQVAQARQAVEVSRAALAQVLGLPPAQVSVVAGRLLEAPAPAGALGEQAPAAHPLAVAQNKAVEQVKACEKVLDRSWYPRFNLAGALYARGTGVQPDGATGNAASGLGPNIQNWGVGLSVTFPALDLPGLRARRQIEQHHEAAEQARYAQLLQDLDGQIARGRAQLDGARRVAELAPAQLKAARDTESQATARYQAGLGGIVDVAEAQRLRTQAEIDDALARLAVWRALLGLAAAQGDLAPFLALAK
jgi:outer membrane protein TolC